MVLQIPQESTFVKKLIGNQIKNTCNYPVLFDGWVFELCPVLNGRLDLGKRTSIFLSNLFFYFENDLLGSKIYHQVDRNKVGLYLCYYSTKVNEPVLNHLL